MITIFKRIKDYRTQCDFYITVFFNSTIPLFDKLSKIKSNLNRYF